MRKILVLSCSGGYGHTAAANTIAHLLQDEWQCAVFHPINELKILGCPEGEAFYNFLISHNFTHATNWFAGCVAPYLLQRRVEKTVHLIERYIDKEKPDLLLSLIPYVNYAASEAAHRNHLPFLITTTDNDLTNWVYGLEHVINPERIKVTIGANLPATRGLLEKRGIPRESIETVGLPLRPNFLTTLDKQRLRFQRGISPSRSVVLIMMGGAGGPAAYEYAKTLSSLPMNLHIIVCAGRNRALAARLSTLSLAAGNHLEILPFTDNVHELMALCDLLITKPGPGTINEGMAFRIPMVIDRLNEPLYWEQGNIDLVESRGVGKAIYSLSNLEKTVSEMLQPSVRERIERAYERISPNRFHERLPGLLDELCSPAGSRGASYATARV